MNSKKILGYVLIVFSILLIVAFFGQLPEIFRVAMQFLKIFIGHLDSYEIGKVLGSVLYWIFHISLTVLMWIYGRRWINK